MLVVQKRRRLDDLVTAFNMLRAKGVQIKLVLSGDSMQGAMNISTEEIQHALKTSSYLEDIIFLGFTDNQTLNWLYTNALAFVFPSKYEGFGLPVLEAMSYGTPVVCYENAGTKEVASDCPIYADGAKGIHDAVSYLLGTSQKELSIIHKNNVKHSEKYSWSKTAQSYLSGN